ncbi:terpene synthase family protein [Nocardia sp. BMG51109]|uniref:terpene synthase family protein n=1 Tax=Nocardia sp. BMG51109 TaxID=1056816 RepID=UPI0012EC8273|nr:terpene synthase family protein [Nocardia sp. BMG51109]
MGMDVLRKEPASQDLTIPVRFPHRVNQHPDRALDREQYWGRHYGIAASEPSRWEKVSAYRPATLITHANPDAEGEVYDLLVDEMCFYVYLDDLIDEVFFEDPGGASSFIGKIADVLDEDIARTRLDRSIPAVAMFDDVWTRCVGLMSWKWRHRAAGHWLDYLWGNLTETIDRYRRTTPTDLDMYLQTRRGSIAMTNCQDKHEIVHGFELPARVLRQPVLQRLLRLLTDLVIVGNDLVSYEKEDSIGDAYNSVLLLRDHHGMTLVEAVEHVTGLATGYANQIDKIHRDLPDVLNDIDPAARETTLIWEEHARLWVGGFTAWQALAPRYNPPRAAEA